MAGFQDFRLIVSMPVVVAAMVSISFFDCSAVVFAESPLVEKHSVLFLGDSLTEGLNLKPSESYPALVEADLKQKPKFKNIEIINGGISGSTSASGPARLKWFLKRKDKPDFLVLALGANDGLRGLDTVGMKKNLSATIKLASENHMKILLVGMKIPPNYGKDYSLRFEKVFAELASENHLPLIPFLLDGVAADRSLNQADGIHPTAAGYKLVAATVLKYLEPLL